ncbi:MAG: UDP-glucose 4-epimerase GalE [Hylemonella sp.]|nr:UDP-glucose 4-epimerase GalE [Hylemonella sp.]
MMIFVTGGAGYIGSHTCVELLQAGFEVTVYDNFSNSSPESIRRVEKITGRAVHLVEGDIRDRHALSDALQRSKASAVIHFAGLKAVGESVEQPLRYYENNVVGTLCLLQAMGDSGVKKLVFSSSATVYGDPVHLPITEDHPLSATNPYGRTKLMIEEILRDLYRSDASWRIGMLRYFNPIGAHQSGQIGEDPQGIPNNLMPYVSQVAAGQRDLLQIWGKDYPTPDGTGVRDFIHVVDLAIGHVKTLDYLDREAGCTAINLGTGRGYSVLELVQAFEKASGQAVPYKFAARRAGDIASSYASPERAISLLGWRPQQGLDAMCADSWRWQQANPRGYRPTSA